MNKQNNQLSDDQKTQAQNAAATIMARGTMHNSEKKALQIFIDRSDKDDARRSCYAMIIKSYTMVSTGSHSPNSPI